MNAETRYGSWLSKCAAIAMQSEWCIDVSWPGWIKSFRKGATPAAAVDSLFEAVRSDWESGAGERKAGHAKGGKRSRSTPGGRKPPALPAL